MNATSKLYEYFAYYDIGNPRYLRLDFMNQCKNDTCSKAINTILDSIDGNFESGIGCDLMTSLYDAQPDRGFYQGHRDYLVNVGAFVINLATLGITA